MVGFKFIGVVNDMFVSNRRFFLYKMTLLLLSCSANLSSTRILFYHGQPYFTDLFINASFKFLDIFLYLSYQLNKLKKDQAMCLVPSIEPSSLFDTTVCVSLLSL